ncbi:MAG: caspase family protein [Alphaproteobacteria bacterium]|jgi:hypothetical protein|nr:caspase family protein [Alphaproteobacteria bacterium]
MRKFFIIGVILTFCVSCATMRINEFHGPTKNKIKLSVDPRLVYEEISKKAFEVGFEFVSGSNRLGVVRMRHKFAGTETWQTSASVLGKYADSMGLFINPYGKNAFVDLHFQISKLSDGQSELTMTSHFQTFGEPTGIGGIGPFSMNSKNVWENQFLQDLQNIVYASVNRERKSKPKTTATARKKEKINFPESSKQPNDVAVIIANSNYKIQGKDIPNVDPAYSDAESFKQWITQAKGVREGNIIYLKDATSAQMVSAFGGDRSHKGQLFNWIKPGISNVYIYYAGHGAPAGDDGSAYLVPSDTNSATVQLTGYPLATLYKNLKMLPAKSITVVLEACFSGASQNGNVISRTSGLYVSPKLPNTPSNITVISAGRADQVASWEQDSSQSLFTKYFLTGMSGEADKPPYGNSDGDVSYPELGMYLVGTMTYFARRYYGRDQNAQIVVGVQ